MPLTVADNVGVACEVTETAPAASIKLEATKTPAVVRMSLRDAMPPTAGPPALATCTSTVAVTPAATPAVIVTSPPANTPLPAGTVSGTDELSSSVTVASAAIIVLAKTKPTAAESELEVVAARTVASISGRSCASIARSPPAAIRDRVSVTFESTGSGSPRSVPKSASIAANKMFCGA